METAGSYGTRRVLLAIAANDSITRLSKSVKGEAAVRAMVQHVKNGQGSAEEKLKVQTLLTSASPFDRNRISDAFKRETADRLSTPAKRTLLETQFDLDAKRFGAGGKIGRGDFPANTSGEEVNSLFRQLLSSSHPNLTDQQTTDALDFLCASITQGGLLGEITQVMQNPRGADLRLPLRTADGLERPQTVASVEGATSHESPYAGIEELMNLRMNMLVDPDSVYFDVTSDTDGKITVACHLKVEISLLNLTPDVTTVSKNYVASKSFNPATVVTYDESRNPHVSCSLDSINLESVTVGQSRNER